MQYYQKNDEGIIVAVCDWEQAGFEYTDEEIVQTYDGRFAFKKDIQNEEYEVAKAEYEKEEYKEELRRRRENECFNYVDRAAWFYSLSEEQKAEVLAWREKWLHVTETLIIPEPPAWLSI